MSFIVIEKHGGFEYAGIVIDEHGNNKIFDNYIDAQKEADQCQDGMVIPYFGFIDHVTEEDDSITVLSKNIKTVIKHNDIGISIDVYKQNEDFISLNNGKNEKLIREEQIFFEDF